MLSWGAKKQILNDKRLDREKLAQIIDEEIKREVRRRRDNDIKVFLVCFARALHDGVGFGKARIAAVLNDVTGYSEQIAHGYATAEEFAEVLREEIGLDIEFEDTDGGDVE